MNHVEIVSCDPCTDDFVPPIRCTRMMKMYYDWEMGNVMMDKLVAMKLVIPILIFIIKLLLRSVLQ